MHYEGNIIRPPSEANSILLQVTVGCSHNKCTFCGAYKGERFTIKKDPVIMEDIEFAARHCRRQNRLFLCDGDALIIPQRRLVPILERINQRLPWIERIGLYANTKSIRMKSDRELAELRALGVKIAYMGLETGDDPTLKKIAKGADAQRMIDMGQKIRNAGFKLSITVLAGIAGRERSLIHARETGRVLTAIDPEYVGALSLMLIPGTPMHDLHEKGEFDLLNPDEMLIELGAMISATNLTKGLFHANHASNYLPIRAELPRDKEQTLAHIAKALEGKIGLKPEFMRAL
ncbi:MAG: radical SAM protein [Desulfobacteraceae bacterium]|nr:radical SAM protein [Desulfobacteraceae bacterium]